MAERMCMWRGCCEDGPHKFQGGWYCEEHHERMRAPGVPTEADVLREQAAAREVEPDETIALKVHAILGGDMTPHKRGGSRAAGYRMSDLRVSR